jgi:hypothetical protein
MMSADETLTDTAMADHAPAAPVPDPQPDFKKSYRRKYRKIMVVFEENMRESNSLFKEEQRLLDISQRLAEQNEYDQSCIQHDGN